MSRLPPGVSVRDLRDDDAPAVVDLVARAYADHPGCVLDLDGVDADLRRPASSFADAGGRGWAAVADGRLVGCVGLVPSRFDGAPAVELERLYVAAAHRRRGLARALVARVEHAAVAEHQAHVVELWSDTRFIDAHRLYEVLGYTRRPETRHLHDPSDTTEYHYVRPLTGRDTRRL